MRLASVRCRHVYAGLGSPPAIPAQRAPSQVDLLHRARTGHPTPVVRAVTKIESMSQLMNASSRRALIQPGIVRLPQADPTPLQHGPPIWLPRKRISKADCITPHRQSQALPSLRPNRTLHSPKDLQGMKLLVFGVTGGAGVEREMEGSGKQHSALGNCTPRVLD